MAKTTIPSPTVSALRNEPHVIEDVFLNITAPQTVVTLTITAINALVPYTDLTVTGSLTGVIEGQLVKVYNGSTLRTWAIVRKAPSGGVLPITPVSLGDSGFGTQIEYAILVGDSIDVYTHHAPFSMYSVIRQQVFYKKWDLPYSDQNSQPPPVANAGVWQQAETASSALFTLPKDGVNTSLPLGSATITGYLWALPSGVTLAGGFALTDQVIQVNATQGQHLVTLTVTDSNSKTHTAYVWLFVHDTTGVGYQSFGKTYIWRIEGDTSSREGREIQFKVFGENLKDVLLPHAGVLFNEQAYAGTTLLTDETINCTFNGYIVGDVTYETINRSYGSASFVAKSPILLANDLVIPPQLLNEVSIPANWTECTSALSNPRGALYYALKWHCPALINFHDFNATIITPRKKTYEYSVGSIGEATKMSSNAIVGNVGCDDKGAVVLRKNPNIESNAYRNAMATVWTWQTSDIKNLTITRKTTLPTGELRGGGFCYDGNEIKAWYGIRKFGQGVGKETMPDFTVTASEGLTRIKEVVGHTYAQKNAQIKEISFSVMGNLDIVEPVYLDAWHKFDLPASYDPYGEGFTSARLAPLRVDRTWEFEDGRVLKRVTNVFELESFGQPAEELPIGSAASSIANGWNVDQPVPYEPESDSLPSLMMVGNNLGQLAVTYNLQASSPEWVDFTPNVTGTVCDACFDYNSAFFTSGYDITQALGAHIVVANGLDLNIYYMYDIIDPATAIDLVHTYTMSDTTVEYSARIQCSKTSPLLVSVAWRNQSGTRVGRSADGGVTWGASVVVGSSVTDTAQDDTAIGLAVEGNDSFVTAPNGSTQYGVYKATGAGAFSLLTGSPEEAFAQPMIRTNEGIGYVSVLSNGAADYTEDFDTPTSLTYTESHTGSATFGVAGGGNPSNCYRWDYASVLAGVTVDMYLTFTFPTAGLSVTAVSADSYVGLSTGFIDSTRGLRTENSGSFASTTLMLSYQSGVGAPLATWNGSGSIAVAYTTTNFASIGFIISSAGTNITNLQCRLDNIVYTLSVPIGGDTLLYRVDNIGGTPTWVDITPATDFVPRLPYEFTVDNASAVNYEVLASDGVDTNYYYSTNSGTSYTSNGATTYRAIQRSGDIILAGGVSVLDVSLDAGTTYESKLGNLDVVWGGVQEIRWLLALI